VSEESLALLRSGYEAVARGEWQVLYENLDPEVEWRALQDTETYRGLDGVRESVSGWAGAWERWDFEALDFIDGGDRIVVAVRERGHSNAAGGIDVEALHFHVWTIREGSIAGFREYGEREEALSAASIAPQDH
jgi:ketosteroid isomerase-like protein